MNMNIKIQENINNYNFLVDTIKTLKVRHKGQVPQNIRPLVDRLNSILTDCIEAVSLCPSVDLQEHYIDIIRGYHFYHYHNIRDFLNSKKGDYSYDFGNNSITYKK